MRKCLRCKNDMIENLEVTASSYSIDIREKGMFKTRIEKIKCAICPECGYTELYIANPEKIKKLTKKDK